MIMSEVVECQVRRAGYATIGATVFRPSQIGTGRSPRSRQVRRAPPRAPAAALLASARVVAASTTWNLPSTDARDYVAGSDVHHAEIVGTGPHEPLFHLEQRPAGFQEMLAPAPFSSSPNGSDQ